MTGRQTEPAGDVQRRRVLARCEGCETVYAAWTWDGDRISIVGTGDCPCGSSDLTVIDP